MDSLEWMVFKWKMIGNHRCLVLFNPQKREFRWILPATSLTILKPSLGSTWSTRAAFGVTNNDACTWLKTNHKHEISYISYRYIVLYLYPLAIYHSYVETSPFLIGGSAHNMGDVFSFFIANYVKLRCGNSHCYPHVCWFKSPLNAHAMMIKTL